MADQAWRVPSRESPQLSKVALGVPLLPSLPSDMCHGAISVSLCISVSTVKMQIARSTETHILDENTCGVTRNTLSPDREI